MRRDEADECIASRWKGIALNESAEGKPTFSGELGVKTEAKRGRDNVLERVFGISARGSTVRLEVFAGATTFLTAAYLAVVIPNNLSTGGMDRAAVTTATLAFFGLGTLGMAFYAKLPFVVGPGIGGSVLVATTLALSEGVPCNRLAFSNPVAPWR